MVGQMPAGPARPRLSCPSGCQSVLSYSGNMFFFEDDAERLLRLALAQARA
jgi:hypothetical protein